MRRLDRLVTASATGHLIDEVRAALGGRARGARVPRRRREGRRGQRRGLPAGARGGERDEGPPRRAAARSGRLRRYQVNVLVDHGTSETGAPVVYEDHPTHRQPRRAASSTWPQLGTLVTDFTLIQAGRPAPRERRLPDRSTPGRLLAAAARLGRAQAGAALEVDPHRVARAGAQPGHDRLARAGADPARRQGRAARRALPLLPARPARPRLPRALQGGRRLRGRDRAHGRRRAALRAPPRARSRAARACALSTAARSARVIEHASRDGRRRGEALRSHAETWPTCCARPTTWPARPGAAVVGRGPTCRRRSTPQVRRASRVRERIQEDIRRGHPPHRHRAARRSAR